MVARYYLSSSRCLISTIACLFPIHYMLTEVEHLMFFLTTIMQNYKQSLPINTFILTPILVIVELAQYVSCDASHSVISTLLSSFCESSIYLIKQNER